MIEVLQYLVQLTLQLFTFVFSIDLGGILVGTLILYFFILTITFKFLSFLIGSDISYLKLTSSTKQKKGGN